MAEMSELEVSARGRARAAPVAVAVLALLVATLSVSTERGSAPERATAAPHDGKGGKKKRKRKLRKLPNVVVMVTDDQTFASYNDATMPFVSGFMEAGGTTFSNAITTSPNCCPSRASILTGQYPHSHRVLSNRLGYQALRGKRSTLPVWLRRKGYTTAHVGKYLNGYAEFVEDDKRAAPGWDEWHTMLAARYYGYTLASNGRLIRRKNRDKDYSTRVITRRATKLVRRYARRPAPLFLAVDYYNPHTQAGGGGRCASAARPDPNDEDLFVDEPLPEPPSLNEPDVEDKPTFIRRLPLIRDGGVSDIERHYGCALASLAAVDRGVERIVTVLEKRGELDKTALFFLSDNGYFYGEHRLPSDKQQAYEEAIRVPFAVHWPAKKITAAPSELSEPVANIDLAPTILELAKARPCRAKGRCRVMDGRSLMPLVTGGAWPQERVLGIEFDVSESRARRGSTCAFDGVRTPIDVYVEHKRVVSDPEEGICEPTNEAEQYQLVADPVYGGLFADPFELRNLASPLVPQSDNPNVVARRAELDHLLDRMRDCSGIPERDPAPNSGHYCQ
jgi:N-acetylglucosamine-6-sulfatase